MTQQQQQNIKKLQGKIKDKKIKNYIFVNKAFPLYYI